MRSKSLSLFAALIGATLLLSEGTGLPAAPSSRPTGKSDCSTVIPIAAMIGRVDDGFQSVDRGNGRIVIKSTAINEIVKKGEPILPALSRLVSNDDVDFDTFARAYSAINQIIERLNMNLSISWGGNVQLLKTPNGTERICPDGQLDVQKFRSEIAVEVEKRIQALTPSSKRES